MKISVNGNQIAFVSNCTKEELLLVAKHVPAALTKPDKDGSVVYRIMFSNTKPGSINGAALVFDSETRVTDENPTPKAALYVQDDGIPATGAAEYVADKYGKWISYAREIEAGLPAAATEATGLFKAMVAAISVEG